MLGQRAPTTPLDPRDPAQPISPPHGQYEGEQAMKVSVINATTDELEAALRDWLAQHQKARIGGTSQSSTSTSDGKVQVTLVIWYQE
jgi:hypothetical protein